MSVASTILVFAVIPLGVIVVVASLVLASAGGSPRVPRYRPGRPYDFQPIWFLAAPERVNAAAALGGHHAAGALEGHQAQEPIFEDSTGVRVRPGSVGGASDSW